MTAITLAQADRLIDAILARGAELDCRPQLRDGTGEVIGAVGVTGDTEERDEELAAHGIRAVGLKTDEDCATTVGRRRGIRLTDT
jgi:hypothetical protein